VQVDHLFLRENACLQAPGSNAGPVSQGYGIPETLQVAPRQLRAGCRLVTAGPLACLPGYHAAVITACHAAGFEPELDDTSTGSTVWNNIAAGRGVALVVASPAPQVRGGIAVVKPGSPPAHIILDALWRRDNEPPVRPFIDTARRVGTEYAWL